MIHQACVLTLRKTAPAINLPGIEQVPAIYAILASSAVACRPQSFGPAHA